MFNAVRLKVKEESRVLPTGEALRCPEIDIAQLVKSAASGDFEAFGEIYTIYLDRIYRYVLYQVGDKTVAEDLAQEIFMKVWRAIGSYKGERQSFSTWTYRIAHNHVIDYLRSNQRYVLSNCRAQSDSDVEIQSHIANPEEEAEKHLMQEELLDLVSSLPSQQKQIVILKFIEGLGNDDIEQITGKTQGAIRIMQMRALATLRQRLIKEEEKKWPQQ